MICSKCLMEIPVEEDMNYLGQVLCEDCYVEAVEPPRRCDVTAVYSAKMARKQAGHHGTDGLTELQKNIYDYVKANGKVTPQVILKEFKLTELQGEKVFTVLRHCELLKGVKIDGVVYITVMEGGPGTLHIEGQP